MAYKIRWQGIEIGTITEKNSDMWYSLLYFTPNTNTQAQDFIIAAQKLLLQETRQDWSKGILVEIYWGEQPINALVLQCANQELYVRSHLSREVFEKLVNDKKA